MPQLDHLIDQWAQSLKASEPLLERHLDEIKDHVHTDAQVRIDAGADVANAFAAAIGAFGPPRELANEFLSPAMPSPTRVLKYTGAYLLAVLVLTAAVVLVDIYYPLDVRWVGIGLSWVAILPVVAVPFYLERAYQARYAGVSIRHQ